MKFKVMKNVLFLILLFQAFQGLGQEGLVLSGNVFDENAQPMLFGNVLLRNEVAEEPIKITYIENGQFTFDPLPAQKYQIEISCLGFEKYQQEIPLTKNVQLNINLKVGSNVLNEVEVIADRDAIVVKNGNLKMRIANTNFAAQPTTTALLSMFPRLLVNPSGTSIDVIGKGSPLIYLDNQRITMDQLNSIAVNSIKDIELINNPSAKYEADGRAVILIRRKKGVGDGIKIDLTEVASWTRVFNNYAGVNASLKRNKLELRSNFSYNNLSIWEGGDADYQVKMPLVQVVNSSVSSDDRPQVVAGGGFYYELNDGDYFSGNANIRSHHAVGPINSTTSIYEDEILSDEIKTLSNGEEDRSFFTSNLNYNNSFTKSKSNLFFGLQYSRYIRNLDNEIFNDLNSTGNELVQERDQDFMIDAYAARIDFEKKILNEVNWEIGTNFAGVNAEAFSEFNFVSPQGTSSSFYDYSETTLAFYSQFSGVLKNMDYSFGIRSETNTVEAGFRSSNELTIDRNPTNIFPRAMLNIPLDSSLNLTLNYTKSIARPNYLNSSSITTYINPLLEYTRNVNLRSVITEEISANLQYKRQSVEISYSRQKDPVFVSIDFDDAMERLVSSPTNLEQLNALNLAITSPVFYKKWSATNFIRFSISEMKDSTAVDLGVTPSVYVFTRHQFRFPKRLSFGATFWGISQRKTGVVESKAYSNLDLFVSKTFKNKFTATLSFNDVYRGFKIASQYELNEIEGNDTRFADRKGIVISLRYSFGKEFKSKYKNKDVDDNLKRI